MKTEIIKQVVEDTLARFTAKNLNIRTSFIRNISEQAKSNQALKAELDALPPERTDEKVYWAVHGLEDWPKCPCCGKPNKRFHNYFEGYYEGCTKDCVNILRYGSVSNFGNKELHAKYVKTIKDRWGGMGNGSTRIHEKIVQTEYEKYGDKYQRTQEYKDKYRKTSLERYGHEHAMQSDEIKQKFLASRDYHDPAYIEKCKEIYDNGKAAKLHKGQRDACYDRLLGILENKFEFLFSKDEYFGIHNLQNNNEAYKYKFKCKNCGHEFYASPGNVIHRKYLTCPNCRVHSRSKAQYTFGEAIQKLNPQLHIIEDATQVLSGRRELDFWIPSNHLAIEYNGTCWHAETFNNVGKDYHLNRYLECQSLGIDYLGFWSQEIECEEQASMEKIKAVLGLLNTENELYPSQINIDNNWYDLEFALLKLKDHTITDIKLHKIPANLKDLILRFCLTYNINQIIVDNRQMAYYKLAIPEIFKFKEIVKPGFIKLRGHKLNLDEEFPPDAPFKPSKRIDRVWTYGKSVFAK